MMCLMDMQKLDKWYEKCIVSVHSMEQTGTCEQFVSGLELVSIIIILDISNHLSPSLLFKITHQKCAALPQWVTKSLTLSEYVM